MKITKFEHSCLLVEMPEPINRTALFDPGVMSEAVLPVKNLEYLDDIIITHIHADHLSLKLVHQLVAKFPEVHMTAPSDVVQLLLQEGISEVSNQPSDGITFFISPHENVRPLFVQPQQIGVHYLGRLSHPGDSHSFAETNAILALPLAGPWASTITAVNLALSLKPQYVLPVHDWHLSDQAREQTYTMLANTFKEAGITFVPLQTGRPVVINV